MLTDREHRFSSDYTFSFSPSSFFSSVSSLAIQECREISVKFYSLCVFNGVPVTVREAIYRVIRETSSLGWKTVQRKMEAADHKTN